MSSGQEINIFVRPRDVVIFLVALAFVLTIAGARFEQHVRSEQVASMVRASFELDQVKAQNEQIELETRKLERVLPVVQSIYSYKNAIAKSEEISGDG